MKKYTIILLLIVISFSGCGQPAIIDGAKNGNLQKVKDELANGVDINIQNELGWTPLQIASLHAKLEIVKYLVEKGADVNVLTRGGGTTLTWASTSGKLEIVKYLVEKGANINVKDSWGWTPLHAASTSGTLEIVKYLVEKGANINVKDNEGKTPLYSASAFGKLEIVKYLVEKGANVNAVRNTGETALSIAKSLNRTQVVQYLQNDYKKDILAQKEENKKVQAKAEQTKVNTFISKKDFEGLKVYTDKNPNAVYYIKDNSLRLLLTGPKGMKVGDIKRLIKEGEDESIIISLIKRVKTPYKEYTLQEIKTLKKLGIKSKVIAAMIDVTTELLKVEENRKQQEYFLAEQKRIKDQKVKEKIIYKNQKTDSQGNPLVEKVQDKLIEQGAKMLFDKLF